MLRKVKSFTLVELIIVVIIVGILASLGLTQYSAVVEKSRLAEAKVRIGTMKQLAYEYYLNNGVMTAATDADMGVNNTCSSTDFYSYWICCGYTDFVYLWATRCTSGGKSPNTSRAYRFGVRYHPGTDQIVWHCQYTNDASSCFGLPP